jgi:hypothetical protein
MATPNQLVKQIQETVRDKSYDRLTWEFILDGFDEIDSSERPVILMDSLRTTGTVATVAYDSTTPVYYVDMPSNYGKHLFGVVSAAQESSEIKILANLEHLYDRWDTLDQSGIVEDVTVIDEDGTKQLWYMGIPVASDTLTLHYYKAIPRPTKGSDAEITVFPSSLQRPLIASWASEKILRIKGESARADEQLFLHKNAMKELARRNRHTNKGEFWMRGRVEFNGAKINKKMGFI